MKRLSVGSAPNRLSLASKWTKTISCCLARAATGSGNKGKQIVPLHPVANVYLPHLNNTFKIFVYGPHGYVGVNPAITNPTARKKAERLMDLVKLDKYKGNPKYKRFPERDKRWNQREQPKRA